MNENPQRSFRSLPDEVATLLRTDRRVLRIRKNFGILLSDHQMIQAGDRILVAVSGGKDSWALLVFFELLSRINPIRFEFIPIHVNLGNATYDPARLQSESPTWLTPIEIETTSIFETVKEHAEEGPERCALCARLRRGSLSRIALQRNCTKIALGHHADDAIHTSLMSLFFEGRWAGMHPITPLPRANLSIIRPLLLCWEQDLAELTALLQLPIINHSCPFPDYSSIRRARMRRLIADLSTEFPHLKYSLLGAIRKGLSTHTLDGLPRRI